MVPYLLVVDLQNTALSGFFTFYGLVLYPTYALAPRISSLSAIDDQTFAGTIMWVPGSVTFLLPAAVIAIKCLSGSQLVRRRPIVKKTLQPVLQSGPFDLPRLPVVGAIMRWRHFRVSLQALLFGLLG
jgi:hypothetical protein